MAKIKINAEKKKEITAFLISRFFDLEKQRKPLDDEVEEEVNLYNNIDKIQDAKYSWEETNRTPYGYTIVQSMLARVLASLFGSPNWLKIYSEGGRFKKIEKDIQTWVQEEVDKMRFKPRARDFLEEAFMERGSWIQLRPVRDDLNGFQMIDFDALSYFDIWYDMKAIDIEDTDVFVKKIIKYWKVRQNGKAKGYFNIEKIARHEPPDAIKENQKYASKHGVSYYDPNILNNTTDEVELLEWYGDYNMGTDEDPDFKSVIFTLANRKLLVRVQTNEMKTRKKKLLFPIRPLRQAKSLLSKSVVQIIKQMLYDLNEIKALRMQNFKLKIKLLFKYNKNANLNFKEFFAKGGNMIGFDDDPNDVSLFDVPEMVQMASFMSSEVLQDAQQATGATDYVMGTTAARGITETARGTEAIIQQAMVKFSMIADNIYHDILEFINYMIILYVKYKMPEVMKRHPELEEFFNQTDEMIENSYFIDIDLKDLSVKRDVERAQFINATNVILPQLEKVGGNIKEFLRQTMDRLSMENIDEIISPPPEAQAMYEQLNQQMQADPAFAQLLQMLMQNPKLAAQILGQMQSAAQGAQEEGGQPPPLQPAQKKEVDTRESMELNTVPEL